MRRTIIAAGSVGVIALAALILWVAGPTTAKDEAPAPANNNGNVQAKAPGTQLPIAQVILFNSGVGYFQREGEVEGDIARRSDLSRHRRQRPAQEPRPSGPGRRQGQHASATTARIRSTRRSRASPWT